MPRFDLHFEGLTREEQSSTTKVFTFGDAEPFGVRGPQFLINTWVKLFFTRQGSDPTNLARGTGFANMIGSSTSLSEAEDIVRISIDQCNTQIRALQQDDTTLEARERLADAKLLRYTTDPSGPGFDAYIEITNEAGERLPVNLPALTGR